MNSGSEYMNRRSFTNVALPILRQTLLQLAVLAAVCVSLPGCNRPASDPTSTLPKTSELAKNIKVGMTNLQVQKAMGRKLIGGSNNFGLVAQGSDGALFVQFNNDIASRVDVIPSYQPLTMQQTKAKLRLGMSRLEVYKAIGPPNGTGRFSTSGSTTSAQLEYKGSDGNVLTTFENDVLVRMDS